MMRLGVITMGLDTNNNSVFELKYKLVLKIKDISRNVVEQCLEERIIEWHILKNSIKKSVENHLYTKTKRRPSVFPIIMEV